MHTLTVYTKFTFGDHVRFDSLAQCRVGEGRVVAITMDVEKRIDYIVAIKRGEFEDLQAGILEHEMTLVRNDR